VSVRLRVQRIEAGQVVWRLLWPADAVFAHITIHYSLLSSRLSVTQKKLCHLSQKILEQVGKKLIRDAPIRLIIRT